MTRPPHDRAAALPGGRAVAAGAVARVTLLRGCAGAGARLPTRPGSCPRRARLPAPLDRPRPRRPATRSTVAPSVSRLPRRLRDGVLGRRAHALERLRTSPRDVDPWLGDEAAFALLDNRGQVAGVAGPAGGRRPRRGRGAPPARRRRGGRGAATAGPRSCATAAPSRSSTTTSSWAGARGPRARSRSPRGDPQALADSTASTRALEGDPPDGRGRRLRLGGRRRGCSPAGRPARRPRRAARPPGLRAVGGRGRGREARAARALGADARPTRCAVQPDPSTACPDARHRASRPDRAARCSSRPARRGRVRVLVETPAATSPGAPGWTSTATCSRCCAARWRWRARLPAPDRRSSPAPRTRAPRAALAPAPGRWPARCGYPAAGAGSGALRGRRRRLLAALRPGVAIAYAVFDRQLVVSTSVAGIARVRNATGSLADSEASTRSDAPVGGHVASLPRLQQLLALASAPGWRRRAYLARPRGRRCEPGGRAGGRIDRGVDLPYPMTQLPTTSTSSPRSP